MYGQYLRGLNVWPKIWVHTCTCMGHTDKGTCTCMGHTDRGYMPS